MRLLKKSKRVSNDSEFIALIQVAREDPEIGGKLKSILSLDDFNRQSMLNTWLEQLRMQRAPKGLISALAQLLDDDVAARALELLNGKDGS